MRIRTKVKNFKISQKIKGLVNVRKQKIGLTEEGEKALTAIFNFRVLAGTHKIFDFQEGLRIGRKN